MNYTCYYDQSDWLRAMFTDRLLPYYQYFKFRHYENLAVLFVVLLWDKNIYQS